MQEKVVSTIFNYGDKLRSVQLNWLALADADLPDSYFAEAVKYGVFGSDLHTLEDVKSKIEEAQQRKYQYPAFWETQLAMIQ